MSEPCGCGTCASCGGPGGVPQRPVGDPLRFRHAAIRQRMLDSIAAARVGTARPLDRLGVRSSDDPAIALIDAQAASLHVLAWTGARLADDGTILRSEDRDALVDLGRLIGYEPRPALSAATTLAFTLETLPGAPAKVRVAKGTKVASVPGQDEKPQVFETDAEFEAVAAWNAIRPVCPLPDITGSTRTLCIAGVESAAREGDFVAVPRLPQGGGADDWLIGRIAGIERVSLPPDPAFLRLTLSDCWHVETTAALAVARAGEVAILARRAAAFGATAPDARAMTDDVRAGLISDDPETGATQWDNFEVGAPGSSGGKTIDLDAAYPEAFEGRLALFTRANKRPPFDYSKQKFVRTGETMEENDALARAHHEAAEERRRDMEEYTAGQVTDPALTEITKAVELARTDFLLSAKVSRITLDQIDLSDDGKAASGKSASLRYLVRELAVFLETERQTLYRPPRDIALPSESDRLVVQGKIEMAPGRRVILSGEKWMGQAGVTGPQQAAVAIVRTAQINADGTTTLLFEDPVAARFRSTRLAVLGNCVTASHGETPAQGEEIIGSGKAGARDQRFALKGKPLAYIPAETPRGYAPAVEVRVGGRAWKEAPHLSGLSAADRAYTVRPGRDGTAVIQLAGQLPSGLNNVTALYRTGGGKAGNLAAGRITMAMVPVQGVIGITNPLPADGGSDAETIEDIRRAAPLSVRTLDKVVSLADYEAFAAAYRGVGKALATLLYAGMRQEVCLTLADSQMQSPAEGSSVVEGLRRELKRVQVPGRTVRIAGFTAIHPDITLALSSDPAFRRKDVEEAVRKRLADRFGPAARPFARALHRSEVLAAAQGVDGVIAATLTVFALPSGMPAEDEGRLLCPGPILDPGTGDLIPAGLLSIDPAQVLFEEMAA